MYFIIFLDRSPTIFKCIIIYIILLLPNICIQDDSASFLTVIFSFNNEFMDLERIIPLLFFYLYTI